MQIEWPLCSLANRYIVPIAAVAAIGSGRSERESSADDKKRSFLTVGRSRLLARFFTGMALLPDFAAMT
jgi:hypothetical protein